jgi:hypothetical protein
MANPDPNHPNQPDGKKTLPFEVFINDRLWAAFRFEVDARDFMLLLLKNKIESRLEHDEH